MSDRENLVAILKEEVFNYPVVPYNPPEKYPELSLLPYKIEVDPANRVYEMIRKILFMYGLDDVNYETEEWNPLSEVVSQGDKVVIKPNLVRERHPLGENAVLSTITHSSVLRPIIDYTILALKGRGEIVICDAPLQSADFDKICRINGLKELVRFYKNKVKNVQISLLDLRREMVLPSVHFGKRIIRLKGDPLGYTIIDLGKDSFHSEIDYFWKKYSITGYDLKTLRKYHTDKKHCYLISNTILDADVVISVPKLKTHKKAGITVALKNFVGINASKDFLPHHREGTPLNGGDEYPATYSITELVKDKLMKIVPYIQVIRDLFPFPERRHSAINIEKKYKIREGNWYGNDTLWRTIVDLNMIVRYADKKGILHTTPQRKFLFIVDGIIAQEGEGPMDGYPKNCGMILIGMNPCAVDYVSSKIMGFRVELLKQVTIPFKRRNNMKYPLCQFDISEVKTVSNVAKYAKIHELKRDDSLKFVAPFGWKILEN